MTDRPAFVIHGDVANDDGCSLPPQFAEFGDLVADWAGVDGQARWDARLAKPMPEIVAFYNRIIERAEDIFQHLKPYPLDALPEPELRLYRLLLALVQASIAVEIHGRPMPRGLQLPHRVKLIRGPRPVA